MICVDHVIGDPVAMFTYRIVGFSDAAEIFVFLSGLACGIAYSRIFEREGLSGLIRATAARAGRIYFYYALSSTAMILIILIAMDHKAFRDYFGVAVEHPFSALWSTLCLISPPPIAGIFVLYIVLTLFVVPAFLGAGDRYRLPALAISGIAWAASQIFPDVMAPLTSRWYLNPLAWQFLFVIGLFVGSQYDSAQPFLFSLARFRWVVVVAWIIVVGTFLYKLMAARSGFDITWLHFEPSTLISMKENLSPLRLVHFLSVVLLVAVYFGRDNAMLKWPIAWPVIKTGMHSLEVFSLTVVLDVLENLIVITVDPSIRDRLVMDGIAFLLMALVALALARRRKMLVRQSL